MKEVLRTCSVCREKKDRKELLRVVREPNGDVSVDCGQKLNGRGAYLCKNQRCIEKAQKSKVLDRQLEICVPQEIFDKLLEMVEK